MTSKVSFLKYDLLKGKIYPSGELEMHFGHKDWFPPIT